MFTNKDVEYRSIYVINCIHDKDLRVSNGELLLEDVEESKTLTKLPFQKILALFVVGHIRITTPLIDKCKQFNVALIVVNQSFRPVFYWANAAEANFLLRQKQYQFSIECFIRMFGFDPYVGVYHRLWFKRKSLVCDLMEPYRCIIDRAIRTAFNRKQFSEKDFNVIKGEYKLKITKNSDYCKVFFDALLPYKIDVFKFIQSYYRCFMRQRSVTDFPRFELQ